MSAPWLKALLVARVFAASPAGVHPIPPESTCVTAAPTLPVAFGAGEQFDYDIDALGAKAATLSVKTLPRTNPAEWQVSATVQTNTFFSKVRKVNGTATSSLSATTLRALRYEELATENEVHREVRATFKPEFQRVHGAYLLASVSSARDFHTGPVALDNLGAVWFMRQLPFARGLPICFDVFALRRMWRLSGKVLDREHVSLPVGEFEAWHLQGDAVRLDDPTQHREVHLWVSDDARRIPLVMVGSIDLGAIRATLTAFERPMDKTGKRRARKSNESPL